MVTAHAFLLTLALTAPGETVLLEFTADWCEPCRTMQPVVQRLAASGYPIRQIDVDRDPRAAEQFQVTGVPCFVMLVDGREVDRVVGGASFARLVQMYEPANAAALARTTPQVRGQSPDRKGFGIPNPLKLLGSHDRPQTPTTPPPDPLTANPSAGPTAGAASVATDVVARSLAATVRIKVDDATGHSYGTGTIIDQHGSEALVVTCGHIFRDSNGEGRITVDLFAAGGMLRDVPAALVSYDLDRDIGLISFRPGVTVQPAQVAPGGYRIAPSGEVFSIGCNHGADPTVQHSYITSVDKYLGPPNIEVAGQPVDGRSGGGLFSTSGLLVGICNAADPADNEGIYASLPTLHWELDRVGQQHVYAGATEGLAGSDGMRSASPPDVARQTPNRRQQNTQPLRQPSRGRPDQALGHLPSGETVQPASYTTSPGDTEVICIIRTRGTPDGPGRVLVLEHPSTQLLQRIREESARSGDAALVPVRGESPRRSAESSVRPLVRAQSIDP